MPEFKNKLICSEFVVPKIVMSRVSDNSACTQSPSIETNNSTSTGCTCAPEIVETGRKKFDLTSNSSNCEKRPRENSYLSSPEIKCSPSPCVFDSSCTISRRRSQECGRSPSRTPSPSDSLNASPRYHRRSSNHCNSRRGSTITATGYEQYQKSLLEVPSNADYGDASSDDLSSEWDSDVPDVIQVQEHKKLRKGILVQEINCKSWKCQNNSTIGYSRAKNLLENANDE
ncbi:hypothetical protein ILUMI_00508 [Ignelater luminosus]|uniref:Uncharacterized protein n=1 Tax=Ignelater luminosus TaxID=2038154 RepID=A0A8K0GMK5_IGNLU|nr:hypothetical protein ILUMI_00508 [Ignelater luminosus]